jgi:hypothetical protein
MGPLVDTIMLFPMAACLAWLVPDLGGRSKTLSLCAFIKITPDTHLSQEWQQQWYIQILQGSKNWLTPTFNESCPDQLAPHTSVQNSTCDNTTTRICSYYAAYFLGRTVNWMNSFLDVQILGWYTAARMYSYQDDKLPGRTVTKKFSFQDDVQLPGWLDIKIDSYLAVQLPRCIATRMFSSQNVQLPEWQYTKFDKLPG